MRRISRFFTVIFFLSSLAFRAFPGSAERVPEKFSHRVEIDAPYEFMRLFQDNLEILKWLDSPRMNLPFFRRLYEETPAQIRLLMATEGFFAPSVDSWLEETDGTWTARFEIQPGVPSRVAAVEIAVEGAITARPGSRPSPGAAAAAWSLPAGEVFRQQAWEQAKRRLLREFSRYEYPLAAIADSRAEVEPDQALVNISVIVDSGPPVTLGELRPSGLERYPERVVANLNFIEPGTPHSRQALLRLQHLLLDSGYFSNVLVFVEPDRSAPELTPIIVMLDENRRREVSIGLSVSSNSGPGGSLEFWDRNFLDRGWRWQNRFSADRVSWQAATGLTFLPDRRGRVHSVSASLLHEDIRNQALDVFRLGVESARARGEFELVTGLHFLREKRRTPARESVLGALVLNNSWTLDRTDDRLAPVSGHLLNIEAGGALEQLLSERTFARVLARANKYFPATPADIFILRGEAGFVFSSGRQGIPAEYLFRAGGAWSVRGYPYQGLGVIEDGAVTGGRYLGVFSAEYNRWVSSRWALALFSDWGNAADELSGFRPVHGYGAGIRVRTPVGPLNFDGAWGRERERLTWHFSLGVPF